MSLDEGPSPRIDELLELERRRSEIMPDAARIAARDALARALEKELELERAGGEPKAATEPAAPRPLSWRAAAASPKVVALVVTALSAGFVAGRASAPTPSPAGPPQAIAAPSSPSSSEARPTAPTAQAVAVDSLPAARTATAPSTAPTASDARTARETRERTLLERAREALARHAHAEALATLDEHSAAFPDGAMAEERELLAIRALDESGRAREASERARLFLAHFPSSVFAAKARRVAERDGGL